MGSIVWVAETFCSIKALSDHLRSRNGECLKKLYSFKIKIYT